MTRKTCILQWEHVVENLEQIVKGHKERQEARTSFSKVWVRGFEMGLEQARQNLEHARNEPFFIVLANAVPTAETQTQLLYSFMEVIYEDIDTRYKEQTRQEEMMMAQEAPVAAESTSTAPAFSEVHHEASYSMMDGIKQWIAGNHWLSRSLKIVEISKFWRIV